MADSGIYEIRNRVNGKRYVGSAVNFDRRWRQHRCELGKGRHNPILQSAWKKYGAANFEFRVIELVPDKTLLIEREQHHIDSLKPEYNCAPIAGSRLGATMSDVSRSRVGAASKRVWSDPEHRQKMSEAHKGQKPTPQQLAKISAALRGRKLKPDHAAVVAANNAARNRSPEHRELMSAYWKGRPKTPEQLAKMAETKRGRPAHNRGVPMSGEQKAKQSASMKARYENDPAHRAKISEATRAAMNRPETRAKFEAAMKARKAKTT